MEASGIILIFMQVSINISIRVAPWHSDPKNNHAGQNYDFQEHAKCSGGGPRYQYSYRFDSGGGLHYEINNDLAWHYYLDDIAGLHYYSGPCA